MNIVDESKSRALKDIFDRYGGKLYKSAYFLLGNKEDAEDLCQDVFCNVFKSLDVFRGSSSLYTWIYRIMLNLYYQRLRNKYKEQAILENKSLPDRDNLTAVYNDMKKNQTETALHDAINSLPNVHKSVIILKYLEGMSYENMAKVLDCPVGTIRSRLYNAKERLKEKLNNLIGGGVS